MKHFSLDFTVFLADIERLYRKMDDAYATIEAQTGFKCRGCEQNCCESRFHHHTLLEWGYLRHGLAQLPAGQQKTVIEKANETVLQQAAAKRLICPASQAGRCLLYACRPMICRLHGVPHYMRLPNGQSVKGPGCHLFEKSLQNAPRLDRTPLYRELATLEKKLRDRFGFSQKIKLTIAQMLATPLPEKVL